jgi:hypothetical protein
MQVCQVSTSFLIMSAPAHSFDEVLTQLKRVSFPKHSDLTLYEPHEQAAQLRQYRLEIIKRPFKTRTAFRRQPPKQLGLIVQRDEDFGCANLTLKYCAVEKSKSRRHDQERSQYEHWHEDMEDILQRAIQSYQDSSDDTDHLLNQPLPVIEGECCRRVADMGGPGLFPATIAAGLYRHFNATKILDLAAGWGDRLLAACVQDMTYVGVDPNSTLQPVHQGIINDWGTPQGASGTPQGASGTPQGASGTPQGACGTVGKQMVKVEPFEDSKWDTKDFGTFDFMLTSPPFFNLEIYSAESTQSSERYLTLKRWLDKFMFASLRLADQLLKDGAHVVIHMCDLTNFTDPSKSVRYTEDIIEFVTKKLKWRCVGQMGYAIKKSQEEDRVATDSERPEWKKKRKIIKNFQDGFRTDMNGVVLAQPLFVFQKVKK